MPNFTERLQHAWNAFINGESTNYRYDYGFSYNPVKPKITRGIDRTIVNSVITQIAIDAAQIGIRHARVDDEGNYLEDINSGLNNCLKVEANIDQSGRAFLQDVFQSLLDEGSIAIVPVDTSISPINTGSYDIETMRVGTVTQWFPEYVKVKLYNEKTGKREEVVLPKRMVAIVQNPLYSVMNEPNSTMQRLIRKLSLLDTIDEQSGSGKLDLIIQLPYVVKSESRKKQAEARRKEIEMQLAGSKYGIAYTDGTEKITQLNRSLENNLLNQVEYLTKMLFNQLGMSQAIFDGTADDKAMLNYYNRTIEPILSSVTDEMKRKFLTKTARTQGQSIVFFRDPFKLAPISQIAEIADKFTRNEIMTSNEIRQKIGMKPADDPAADELRNSNLYPEEGQEQMVPPEEEVPQEEYEEPIEDQYDYMNTPVSEI